MKEKLEPPDGYVFVCVHCAEEIAIKLEDVGEVATNEAYELADELDRVLQVSGCDNRVPRMLRQQADRIAELEKGGEIAGRFYWESVVDGHVMAIPSEGTPHYNKDDFPLYTTPQINSINWVYDNGKWEVCVDGYAVWLDSDDFTHDASLQVAGDFKDLPQKFAYAKEIAKRLNMKATPQIKELSDEEIVRISKTCDLNHVLGLIDFARAILKKASEK